MISITSGADVRVFYMQMPDPTMHTAQVTDKLVVRPMVRLSTMVKVLIAIGLVCIAIVAYLVASRSGAPTQFVTRSVTRGAITQSVTATGYVNPVLTITVGSYVSGVIQSIYCDYNTHVTKGQLCAKIDARPYQAVVDQDQASLQTAAAQLLKDQHNLEYVRVAYARFQKLFAAKATSRDSVDVAENNYAQATAQVTLDRASIAEHQAALKQAEVNLGYTNIVSPVDGTVVLRNVTIGQTVAASFQTPTLFLIATDLSKMQVDTNVSESDIGNLRIGEKALFSVEAFANKTFEGLVTQVRQAPQTVQNVVTYDVVLDVDNASLQLKPGMTATVRIISQERNDVLRVPNQALRYRPNGSAISESSGSSHVWVLRNNQPERVEVRLGLADDNFTEVVSGEVRPGDKVIVSEHNGEIRSQGVAAPRF